MANLNNTGVKGVESVTLKVPDQVIMVWYLNLQSDADLLTVPKLDSSSGVGSLTASVSVAEDSTDEGDSIIAITGGSLDTKATIVTSHRVGMSNHTTIDEDPTVGGS